MTTTALCHADHDGLVLGAGQAGACRVAVPETLREYTHEIAGFLQDAVAAAEINRARFKLKLHAGTTLQAEYDRADMVPIVIWQAANRGEAAALAAVLRPALAQALPHLTY